MPRKRPRKRRKRGPAKTTHRYCKTIPIIPPRNYLKLQAASFTFWPIFACSALMLQVAKSLITGFKAPHSRACSRGDSSCPQDKIDMQCVKGELPITGFLSITGDHTRAVTVITGSDQAVITGSVRVITGSEVITGCYPRSKLDPLSTGNWTLFTVVPPPE
jgi:hypothetical protein